MAREFWEIFLPEDISIVAVKWDGKAGQARLDFCYKDNYKIFSAIFSKSFNDSGWFLEEIKEKYQKL
jgi:hypothetical protein